MTAPHVILEHEAVLAALEAGPANVFELTRRVYPFWTYDDVHVVGHRLGELVRMGSVQVSGVIYSRKEG